MTEEEKEIIARAEEAVDKMTGFIGQPLSPEETIKALTLQLEKASEILGVAMRPGDTPGTVIITVPLSMIDAPLEWKAQFIVDAMAKRAASEETKNDNN